MNKKIGILLIIAIMLTMMFFTYEVVITYDTSHYLWLTSLLTESGDFSTWDVARGPIFPALIRIFNLLFGQSSIAVIARNVYILHRNVDYMLFYI